MRTADAIAVREVLEDYIRGTRNSDAELLRGLFHPGAVVAGHFGEELLVSGPDSFIEKAAVTPAGPDYTACVASVSVIGRTATACVVEDGLWGGMSFVNRFHLVLEPDGDWVITAKLYHRD